MNETTISDVVPCDVYVDNVTSAVREQAAAVRRLTAVTDAEPTFFLFLSNVAEPGVCLFGIAGNILNLIILTRKRLQRLVSNVFAEESAIFVKPVVITGKLDEKLMKNSLTV